MESADETCRVYFYKHSPDSDHTLLDIKRETCDPSLPLEVVLDVGEKREMLEEDTSPCSVEVKREQLEQDISCSSVEEGNSLEPNDIKLKNEPENREEHITGEEDRPIFLKNPFALIRERLKKMRSKSRSKVMELENQLKSNNISNVENQTEILKPLDIEDSKNALDFKEEKIDQDYANIPMPYQYTIKESELIIKSDEIYKNNCTSPKVDAFTNTDPCDYNFSQESTEFEEEFATMEKPLLLCYQDVPHENEYSLDNVTDAINNPFSYSVKIINVQSLAKKDNPFNTSTQSQPPLKKKVGRPKRTATTKQISYCGSADNSTYSKHKNKKRKIKKSSSLSDSSHCVKTKDNAKYLRSKYTPTKTIDFPRPLKLEIATNSTVENDIATELPRPMVLKCESKSNAKFARYYRSWKLQPKVCLKRLNCRDMIAFQPKEKSTRFENKSFSYSRPDILEEPKQLLISDSEIIATSPCLAAQEQTCYHSSTPGMESLASNSHFDSGISTSSHSRIENENVLLEIAAERAFINHHLTNFGFSPIQFGLYNDYNELCIFLKYLCGKLNTLN